MTVKVKICGINNGDALKSAIENGADYVGFVFFSKSPRHVTITTAIDLSKKVPKNVKKIVVVVDMPFEELKAIVEQVRPDYVQLHGDESLDYIDNIKANLDCGIIKAIKVRKSDDIASGFKYMGHVDMLLFDAKAEDTLLPGGNGKAFDWELLRNRMIDIPWILSGGLNLQNVTDAISITGANMVDVSSSLESAPGVKDPELIKLFIKEAKKNLVKR